MNSRRFPSRARCFSGTATATNTISAWQLLRSSRRAIAAVPPSRGRRPRACLYALGEADSRLDHVGHQSPRRRR